MWLSHPKQYSLQDIIQDNIVMNHHGKRPTMFDATGKPLFIVPEFRSTFPVRYAFIDFGFSASFAPDSDVSQRLKTPFIMTRPHRPMEMDGRFPYDPFAADVYQVARFLYAFCNVSPSFGDFSSWVLKYKPFHKAVIPDVPGLLSLLKDMSSPFPPSRISISTAKGRLRALRLVVPRENLGRSRTIMLSPFPPIPLGFTRTAYGLGRYYLSSFVNVILVNVLALDTHQTY
jgi:serine/threonine protein kinase